MVRVTPLRVVVICGIVAAFAATAAASGTAIRSVQTPDGSDVNAVAVGTTLTVEGTTNLRPDENAIVVELETDPGDIVAVASTTEWGTDGIWTVTVDTTGLDTGAYTLVADDGYGSDVETVRLVRSTPTKEPTPEPTPTEEPTPEPTPVTPEPATTAAPPTRTATPVTTRGDGSGPGIGVALLATAAGLSLARRRT
jgi:hypothetical protein